MSKKRGRWWLMSYSGSPSPGVQTWGYVTWLVNIPVTPEVVKEWADSRSRELGFMVLPMAVSALDYVAPEDMP